MEARIQQELEAKLRQEFEEKERRLLEEHERKLEQEAQQKEEQLRYCPVHRGLTKLCPKQSARYELLRTNV